MPSQLDAMFSFHQKALDLRAYRGQVLASNIVNADTPGFRARDFDFNRALGAILSGADAAGPAVTPGAMLRTSARHLAGNQGAAAVPAAALLYRPSAQPSVDGNTVNLDVERSEFAQNAVHFEANLMFIQARIKTMLAALQG